MSAIRRFCARCIYLNSRIANLPPPLRSAEWTSVEVAQLTEGLESAESLFG
jgi:hypothetical protein